MLIKKAWAAADAAFLASIPFAAALVFVLFNSVLRAPSWPPQTIYGHAAGIVILTLFGAVWWHFHREWRRAVSACMRMRN
jgi:high-affinity Fe2+/Pb2+ permease